MRFFKAILILAAFLFGTESLVFSADSRVRVTASKANIRLKPDTQSVIVTNVPLGAVLDVIKKEGDWYYVKLPPDEKGIVIAGYLHQSTVEAVEEINQPVEPEKKIELPQVAPRYAEPKQDVSTDADYLRWKQEYSKAETTFNKWRKYRYIGMLACFGGILTTPLWPVIIRGDGAIVPMIAGITIGIAGGGLLIYSGIKRGNAAERMNLLMNEGRIKKFISVYVNPGRNFYAVCFSITF